VILASARYCPLRGGLIVALCGTVQCADPSAATDAEPKRVQMLDARVTEISVSLESVMYQRVHVRFENRGAVPLHLVGYTISWPGGSKQVVLDAVTVPAHGVDKVFPDSEGLRTLTLEAAKVVPVLR
jgi:hypothetical protein